MKIVLFSSIDFSKSNNFEFNWIRIYEQQEEIIIFGEEINQIPFLSLIRRNWDNLKTSESDESIEKIKRKISDDNSYWDQENS